MNTRDMKIGRSLNFEFGLILFLVVILVTFTVSQLFTMNKHITQIETDLFSKSRAVNLISLIKDNGSASVEMLLSTNSDHYTTVAKQLASREQSIADILRTVTEVTLKRLTKPSSSVAPPNDNHDEWAEF